MKSRLASCLILAAAAFMPAPVSAQGLLPPYEIVTSIRSMGLEPVSTPVRRGQRYEIIAIDRRGVGVKVAADGFSGRVLFVEELDRPVRASRASPPDYSDDEIPPRQGYQQQGSSEPGDPSVIYAFPRETNPPRPPARVPSVAKPPVPKVATKPPAKPAPPAEAAAPTEASPDTTGSTTATAPPPSPAEKNPALTAPPVQGFD